MKNSFQYQPNALDAALFELALTEDLGVNFTDLTTDLLFKDDKLLKSARIISKHAEPIVLCGLPIVKAIFDKFTQDYDLKTDCPDGSIIHPGETLLTLTASANLLLKLERIILNFLQRLCAIATVTAKYVTQAQHTSMKILDTRKTAPGMRILSKYAVACGGGINHRMGLYDAVMIKDTHINMLGGLKSALEAIPHDLLKRNPVIVEVSNLQEFEMVLQYAKDKISHVLLDNMQCPQLQACVELGNGVLPLEASGNIGLHNIKEIAETGVDFASVGALTHSAGVVDLSMKCD